MLVNVIEQALARSPEYKKYCDELAAENAAKERRLVDQASQPLREANAMQKKLMVPIWSQPVPELKAMFRKAQGNKAILTTYFWDVLLRGDTTPIPQEGDPAQIFDEFVEKTLPSLGWRLSVAGCTRLWAFCYCQREVGGNPITPENLALWHTALATNGCYDDATGEASFDESRVVRQSEPVKKVSLDEIDGSTPEGRQAERELVQEQVNESNLPLQRLWYASLAENFDGFQPTKQDWEFIVTLFRQHNLNPNNPKSYDRVRRLMCRLHRWDAKRLLTIDDLREQCVDRLDMSDSDIRHTVWNATNKDTLIQLLERHGVPLAA